MSEHRYAGWFVLDVRLLAFVVLISVFLTLGILALFFRGRRWHEYATAFVGIFLLVLAVTLLVFNRILSYPVFAIEDLFPFP